MCGGDRDRGSANDAEARSVAWLTARPQRISQDQCCLEAEGAVPVERGWVWEPQQADW